MRAILQKTQPSHEKVVVLNQESKESFVEASSQSLEFPSIFHPRQQSTPENGNKRKGNISSDQYHYLLSLIEDQGEKLMTLDTEIIRLKADIKKLKASSMFFT